MKITVSNNFSFITATIIFFLICSTITGPAISIGAQELQIFRIMVLLTLLLSIRLWWKNSIHFSSNTVYFGFFIYFDFIWTSFVALFSNTLEINNFINSFMLILLILILIVVSSYRPITFIRLVYLASLTMFCVMIGVASWEIITGKHLATSAINHDPYYLQNVPTTFFTNQNDFMAVMDLILLLVFNYHKFFKLKKRFIEFLLFSLIILLCIITGSRTNIAISIITICLFWLNKRNFLQFFTGLICFYFLIILVDTNYLENFLSKYNFDYQMIIDSIQFFGGDESSKVRVNLYLDAIQSISNNYGLGEGLNNSSLYFNQLNDSKLEGIINPHNYLLEILINSGLFLFTIYLCIIIKIVLELVKNKKSSLAFSIFFYFFILISSSSSLYIFYHYVFLITILTFQSISKRFDHKITGVSPQKVLS